MATPQFRIQKVYYTPDVDVVSIALEATNGPFKGQIKDVYTSQEKLQEIAGAGATWGDTEIRAESTRLLEELGGELAPPTQQEAEQPAETEEDAPTDP